MMEDKRVFWTILTLKLLKLHGKVKIQQALKLTDNNAYPRVITSIALIW